MEIEVGSHRYVVQVTGYARVRVVYLPKKANDTHLSSEWAILMELLSSFHFEGTVI
jgi:hypothetical protein